MTPNFPQHIKSLAFQVEDIGGKAYLAGGSVRDMILGIEPKDFDLEVYGLPVERIRDLLLGFGKVDEVGKSFGVLLLTLPDGTTVDVSLPRRDSKVGEGHRGFSVATDPFMSTEEACRRRDFTINSMLYDVLTGEVVDHYGGREDLEDRVLRMTDAKTFVEDPLRAMRALQFMARFDLTCLDSSTGILIETMLPSLKELPKERMLEEWKKLLYKSAKPSLGLEYGYDLGVYPTLHPEIQGLMEEGEWGETIYAVDAVRRRAGAGSAGDWHMLMWAALCHRMPENDAVSFLASLGLDNGILDKVPKIVSHLYTRIDFSGNDIDVNRDVRNLARSLWPATVHEFAELTHVVVNPLTAINLWRQAEALGCLHGRPESLTKGDDWISLGFDQGPKIGEFIRRADYLRDRFGLDKEQAIRMILKDVAGL